MAAVSLRVGIDARSVLNGRGIGNVVFNLLQELSKVESNHIYFIYIDDDRARVRIPTDSRFNVRLLKPRVYPLWEQISLPLYSVLDRLDILHCPGNSGPIFLPKSIKLILSIMDVMFMFPKDQLPSSPSLYQRIGRKYLKYIVPIAAKKAVAITTISSASRADILKYISLSKTVDVIWLAANEVVQQRSLENNRASVLLKYKLKHSFIMVLGALDPRKNTEFVLRSYAKFLKKDLRNKPPKLLVVGLMGSARLYFSQIATKLNIENNVVFADFVSDHELSQIYSAAELLLYPSLYEGFGLPILEAMAHGTPVITSRNGSIPEIAAEAALYVNPLDEAEMADAISLLLTDNELAGKFIKKGAERAKLFSWKIFAEKTLEVYDRVGFEQ